MPSDHVLGEVNGGFATAMRTLDLFRPSVGAFAVGMAQSALDTTARYVCERWAFGKPLAQQQAIAHRLADLTTRVAAARLLVHQAARAYDARAPRIYEGASEIQREIIARHIFRRAASQVPSTSVGVS